MSTPRQEVGVAACLVGHGPYRSPRPIGLQWMRIHRYRRLLGSKYGDAWSPVQDYIDINYPRADTKIDGQTFPAVGEMTVGLLSACARLTELLETPEDAPFRSHLIQREIIYRILRTPQGERLRAIATTGGLSHRTARAIAWLRTNYAKPLHMGELAAIGRIGVSTLHHQFRALTAMSPLQYQKQLRLQTARQRMLMEGIDATSAAYEVGYESVSQFSGEYSRFFGQPPIRDIKTLRDGKVVATNVA